MSDTYKLPKLKYEYWELWPHITEEQLRIHHDQHHQAYVKNANKLSSKLETARDQNDKKHDVDLKALTQSLTFNVGGHKLHSLFWENLQPTSEEVKIPAGLKKALKKTFDSLEEFQTEFSQVAQTVEGSGWAALVYDKQTDKLLISQIEKHNLNLFPNHDILLVLDVWEHAYYIDYKNDRKRYIQGFWEIVNWGQVQKRYKEARS